ncbi:deoxyribonuclease-1 isoform X1 [Ovis canadensis]|uniref:deoxyribonuclease-1 isoform X1 n=1 Tax=Ovis canadensis TaxID=37174 RepID=UPI0037506F78
MVAACFVPAADLHFRSFLCRVICGLRLLRRSASPHRSPSEETTGYQGICTGCLCGLLRLQQSLGTGDPDRQGHPPQATLALAGMSRTGLIPGLLRSSLLLPETLSLDPRLCFYAGPGGKRLESQPHRDVHAQPASQTSLPSYPPEPPALYFSDAFQVANRLLLAMELLTEDRSCRGLKAPAQRTGAPPWDPQHRGELEEDEGHQADRAAARPRWLAAAGPVLEDSCLQHPHLRGDQDVQCYALQLYCADPASLRHRPHPGGQRQPPGGRGEAPGRSQPVGMTQTPTTMWSVSRWAATATRSATSLCSDPTRCPCWTPTSTTTAASPAETTASAGSPLWSSSHPPPPDVMLMGDFNADCSYVTSSQWSSIRLRTSSTFQWLIPDSADTTATSTNCAYDRIVVAGSLLQSSVVPGSAVPFDFQAAYGLSNEMALAISDHYPVEVTLT